jgi:hypothetical protein
MFPGSPPGRLLVCWQCPQLSPFAAGNTSSHLGAIPISLGAEGEIFQSEIVDVTFDARCSRICFVDHAKLLLEILVAEEEMSKDVQG